MEVDYTNRKIFCIAPWSTMQVLPTGEANLCCLSPSDKVIGNITDTSIGEVWNGDKMKEIRMKILNDEPIPEYCSRCYQKEAEGFSSLRNGLNSKYAESLKPVVESTNSDGSLDEVTLKHWDFRFSNICNFACRTCGPGFSTKWINDYKKVYDAAPVETLVALAQRADSPLLSELKQMVGAMESLHLAGGEPLITEAHYHLLDMLLETGAKGKDIQYSTNFSITNFKKKSIFDYWEELCKSNKLRISISVDGVNEVFNYARYPGNFDEVIANIQELKSRNIQNLEYYIHPTVSILTVFDLPRLHRYFLENDLFHWFKMEHRGDLVADKFYDHYTQDFMINVLIYPNHYAITNLPNCVKDEVKVVYGEHIKYLNSIGLDSSGFQKVLDSMYSAEPDPKSQEHFRDLTRRLDTVRNSSFAEAIPQLKDFYERRTFDF